MKVLRRIKARIRKWRSDRFLNKHNCTSYKQYNRFYDPGVNFKAACIDTFYSKLVYPYVYHFSNPNHTIHQFETDGFHFKCVGFYEVNRWCEKNCKGKFRFDHHLVIHEDHARFNVNGISTFTVAFSDEKDYTWFMLRWS